MQHIDDIRKPNGINRPVSTAVIVGHNLYDSSAAKALQRLRIDMLAAQLRLIERMPNVPLGLTWQGQQVLFAGSNPTHWLESI